MDRDHDPLAQLSPYEVRHLAAHLADVGQPGPLHRLLALRNPDGSNAWYAAKRDPVAYLDDLSAAWDVAARDDDYGRCIRYSLIKRRVRRASTVPPAVLAALVGRGRLPLAEALSLARSAEQRGDQIKALVPLLPRLSGLELAELTREVLALMHPRDGGRALMAAGSASRPRERPLRAREHMETVARLADIARLDQAILAELVEVAREAPSSYSACFALAAVAVRLDAARRREVLAEAWSVASQLPRFGGRPEAQALVASRVTADARGEVVAQAFSTAVDVLRDVREHMKADHLPLLDEDPLPFTRSPLLRLADFAWPLRLLAPALDEAQVRSVLRTFADMRQAHEIFAALAVLPRLAQLGFPDEAWQRASGMGHMVLLAVAELGYVSGGLPGVAVNELPALLPKIENPQLRTISRVALAGLLDAGARRDAIADVLGETVAGDATFRSEVAKHLPSLVRSLPAGLRDPLITRISAGDPGLTSSADDAAAILGPLADVMPTPMLEQRLAASRSVAVAPELIAGIRRTPASRPFRQPSGPALPSDLAREALEIAREMPAYAAASALVFLAPILGGGARERARRVARTIELRRWQAEPLWRLLKPATFRTRVAVAECLAITLGTPGLEHFQPLIDEMAVALGGSQARERAGPWLLPTVDAFLRSDSGGSDIAAAMPLMLALGGSQAREQAEQAVSDLAVWFGAQHAPRTAAAEAGSPGWVVMADPTSGGAELIEAFAVRRNWSAVRLLLDCLSTTGETAPAGRERAERFVVGRLAPTGDAWASPDPHHVALVASIAGQAASRELRVAGLAALLRHAARTGDATGVAKNVTSIEAELDGVPPENDTLAAAADLVEATALTQEDMTAAARHLDRLVRLAGDHDRITGAYSPVVGELVTRAAAVLSRGIDGARPPCPAGEDALGRYFGYVDARREDWALQEAAGGILHERVRIARAAGRRAEASWLGRLDELADADDPHETILHRVALEARCDAAVVLATADDVEAAAAELQVAFQRWRRHPGSRPCSEYFVTTALAVGDAARRAANPGAEANAVRVAATAVHQAGNTGLADTVRRRTKAGAADLPEVP